MNVDVDKIKDKFLNRINDQYNQEKYFIESCNQFPDKYSLSTTIADLELELFFRLNNFIHIGGKCIEFCKTEPRGKIRLKSISTEISTSDINITNNYILDDKWEQTDW